MGRKLAIQFDSLRYVEKLTSAGIPKSHAKAKVEALSTAMSESAFGSLASKDDITTIKIEMADVKPELKLLKWILVTIAAGVLSTVVKAFF